MSYTVSFIAHPQSAELRLQATEHQTSFTLALHVQRIPDKTLAKIESWCLEYLDTYSVYRIMQELRQTNVQGELQKATAQLPATSPLTALSPKVAPISYAVCDYSTQGNLAVWGGVITHSGQTIRCCGQVPAGHRGEMYAIQRTYQYLKRLRIKATIYSDEEGSVKKLQAQFPVQHMSRSDPQHCPAHQLAHHFALLLSGQPDATLTALTPLLEQVWSETPGAEYICLNGKWQVSLLN